MKPIRMCAVCHQRKEKEQLFKVVRPKDGQPMLDLEQRINGRSVYVCKDQKCVALAEKSKLLSRAFKVSSSEIYEELKSELQQN